MTVSSPVLKPLIILVNFGNDWRTVPLYSRGFCRREVNAGLCSTVEIKTRQQRHGKDQIQRSTAEDIHTAVSPWLSDGTSKPPTAAYLELMHDTLPQVLESLDVVVLGDGRSCHRHYDRQGARDEGTSHTQGHHTRQCRSHSAVYYESFRDISRRLPAMWHFDARVPNVRRCSISLV